jgi:hypothetical protein
MIPTYGVLASGGIFGNHFTKGHMAKSQELNPTRECRWTKNIVIRQFDYSLLKSKL